MLHDNLTLNDEKTELLIIGALQQLEKVVITHIRVGNTNIYPVPLARNLGSWFDANISMTDHISKTCSSSFYYLYNLRQIRKYLSNKSTELLVHALESSRFDYSNSFLYGLPNWSFIKLQNACARLIFAEGRYCQITPLFIKLHWLPIKSRIAFKILSLTFKILHGRAPTYLDSLISLKPQSCYKLRSSCHTLLLNPSASVSALMTLIDFTLSKARRFYSSMKNPSDTEGLSNPASNLK